MSQLPYYLRDRINKCERCGKVWVGVPSILCGDCRPAEPVNHVPPTVNNLPPTGCLASIASV